MSDASTDSGFGHYAPSLRLKYSIGSTRSYSVVLAEPLVQLFRPSHNLPHLRLPARQCLHSVASVIFSPLSSNLLGEQFEFLEYIQSQTTALPLASVSTLRPRYGPCLLSSPFRHWTRSPLLISCDCLSLYVSSLAPKAPSRAVVIPALVYERPFPGTSCSPLKHTRATIGVLHCFVFGGCPSNSNCLFLHLPLCLLRPPYLIISTAWAILGVPPP